MFSTHSKCFDLNLHIYTISYTLSGARNYISWRMYGVLYTMKLSTFILPTMCGIIGAVQPCSPPSMLREFLPRCENPDGLLDVTMILVAFLNGLFQSGLFYIYVAVVVLTLGHVIIYPAFIIDLWICEMNR